MKILLLFVLLLTTSSTVISVTGFNDKLILQPVSSPGLVLRKVPRTLSQTVRMPARRTWPNVVLLKNLLELECLKDIYGQGRKKNRPGSTRPESFVPGQEGPAYRTVNKNQGNNYDKIPDPYRPSTSFENGKRYFGENVRVVPIPVPYRNNKNGYQRYKADSGKERSKFNKGSSPHSNHVHNTTEIENSKDLPKKSPPHYTTTSRSNTTTTTKSLIESSVNKPIKVYPSEITDEHVIPFKHIITGSSGIPKRDNLPTMVSYGDAKTFSKFSHQSNRRKPTTASYPENTSSNNLWYGSKPRPYHSYEVDEIIEENITYGLEEKKEENHMTKKPPGGRQFKFDENVYEGFKIAVPNMMKPAKNKVMNSSINAILSSLISPVERITETKGKTPDKSNSAIITTSSPGLGNSSSLPKNENFTEARETPVNSPPLLPHASADSSLSQEDKTDYVTNKKDLHIPPYRPNNYSNSFRASTTEKAQSEENNKFLSRQSVSIQNWEPHSARKYYTLPLQPFSKNINYKNIAEMGQKTDDDLLIAKPNDLFLPEVFRDLANEFSKADRLFPTPQVASSEENKISSTFSPIPYDQQLNSIPTNPRNHSNQSTTPPKSTQQVLFTANYSAEAHNNLDSQIFKSLPQRKEEKSVQQFFTSVPLSEFTVEDQNTETEQPEKDERTSTESEFLDIQTKHDLLDADRSKSKPETEETDQSLLMPVNADDQHSISESVEYLFTTEFYTENTTTGVLDPGNGESSSSSFTTVSKNDVKFTTDRNYFEEDEDVKTTAFEELMDVSMTVDLLNTSKKDSAQESNWKNSRKMHFNQEPAKVILDNRITDTTEIGQRRSDILINDTLEDYAENQNQIHSLSYLDNLKGNSSHLSPGSLIKIAPESIIPIIPRVINDLRDGRFSEENLKVLSHAFGKYWPYIQALSNNTNLDVLPLIKMKDEKDLESILTSFVLEEPNKPTTTVEQRDDENVWDYAHVYDYLGDYKEVYQDLILNQELGRENKEKIRIKRDEEDDLKTREATREYFESIAEEQNEEGSDYIYEDVMYDDIPYEESDSSIFELTEIADQQVYVRNVTS